MTRALLYEEYKEKDPNLYSYSQFNRYYAKYVKTLNPSIRQVHYDDAHQELEPHHLSAQYPFRRET